MFKKLVLLVLVLSCLSVVADERKEIQQEIESAIEKKNPTLALTLLLENHQLFPASTQHQLKFYELKSTILLEVFKSVAGYTFPREVENYIKEGAIDKVEEWIHKVESRQSKRSKLIHVIAAYYAITYMYVVGLGVEKDHTDALKWISKISVYRSAPTGGEKSHIMYAFFDQIDKLIHPAFLYYKSAIALHRQSLHHKESYAQKLSEGSFKLMSESAALGYPPAQVNVALNILQRKSSSSRQDRRAFQLMMEVANLPVNDMTDSHTLQAIIRAQVEIANMYLKGLGTETDISLALEWSERAMKMVDKTATHPNTKERALALIGQAKSSCPRIFSANHIF